MIAAVVSGVIIGGCCVILIVCTIILIIVARKEVRKSQRNNKTNNQNNSSKKHNKHHFDLFYKTEDIKIKSYEIGFASIAFEAFVYKKVYRDGRIKYHYRNINDDETGKINFKDGSYMKLILDTCLTNYMNTGKIKFNVNDPRARDITSDIFIREDYDDFVVKNTFNVFDDIHKRRTNNSHSGTRGDMSDYKRNIIIAFKFFGFNKVVTFNEVKTSYRSMALVAHPDRGGSEERMKEVNDKFDILKKYFKEGK